MFRGSARLTLLSISCNFQLTVEECIAYGDIPYNTVETELVSSTATPANAFNRNTQQNKTSNTTVFQ
jgi:hypothetical protein